MKKSIRAMAVGGVAAGLTSVTAVTGAPAQAVTVSTTIEQINVTLSTIEARQAANSVVWAFTACWSDVMQQTKKFITIPLSVETCTYGLNECSKQSKDQSWPWFTIVFVREGVICAHP